MTIHKSFPQTATDDAFMAAALALGRRNLGRTAPNPAVGALLVRDGADLRAVHAATADYLPGAAPLDVYDP